MRGMSAPPVERSFVPAEPTVVQAAITHQLDASVGAPESALAASLLVGAKQDLPQLVVDDFRASGLSHLLAVSGYNVTLVANLLLSCGRRWLPKRWQTVVAIMGVAAFVWVAGASAAVVRAGVMGSLASLALYSGRTTAAGRALLVAAAAMALVSPSIVVADVGFQLSFAATAAILVLVPRLNRWLAWLPDVLGIRTSLSTTLAATLGTLPVVAVTFGRVSTVGIIANVAAAPLVPLAMATAAGAAALGATPPGLAAGYLASAVLRSLEAVAHLAALLPGAQLELR
jgi:competence protein ComEC